MKTSIYSHQRRITAIALLAAVPLMWACSDEQEADTTQGVAAQITADISETPTTRAVDDTWQDNDEIGVCVTNAPSSNMETTYTNVRYREEKLSADYKTATFAPRSTAIYFQNATENVTFAAYAPYKSSVSGGKLSFDCSNYNGSATAQKNIDFIYAGGVVASAANPKVNFNFSHVMAKLDITFSTGNDALGNVLPTLDELKTATIKLMGLTPKGTLDVTSGVVTPSVNEGGWDITDCYQLDDGSNMSLYYSLIVPPQDLRTGGLTLLLNVKGLNLATTVIDEDLNLESGNVYSLAVGVFADAADVTVKTYGITVEPWTEGSSSDKVTQ